MCHGVSCAGCNPATLQLCNPTCNRPSFTSPFTGVVSVSVLGASNPRLRHPGNSTDADDFWLETSTAASTGSRSSSGCSAAYFSTASASSSRGCSGSFSSTIRGSGIHWQPAKPCSLLRLLERLLINGQNLVTDARSKHQEKTGEAEAAAVERESFHLKSQERLSGSLARLPPHLCPRVACSASNVPTSTYLLLSGNACSFGDSPSWVHATDFTCILNVHMLANLQYMPLGLWTVNSLSGMLPYEQDCCC